MCYDDQHCHLLLVWCVLLKVFSDYRATLIWSYQNTATLLRQQNFMYNVLCRGI